MAGSVGAMSVQAAPVDTYEFARWQLQLPAPAKVSTALSDSRVPGSSALCRVLAAKAANLSWLTPSKATRSTLFVVNEKRPGPKRPGGARQQPLASTRRTNNRP